jgi:hypothetical protein
MIPMAIGSEGVFMEGMIWVKLKGALQKRMRDQEEI